VSLVSESTAPLTAKAISELRRISGLTWEQLGELFGVSRRSVHFWASGKPMNADNERRLLQALDVVRIADRGSARTNRSALMEAHDGTTAFELLAAEEFDRARALLGRGMGRKELALGPLSPAAAASRTPPSPDVLVEAQHDSVHRETGPTRTARARRGTRRGTSP
jgi:transcriptional regulator with XRE-family HTH domain